jgi:hypothetical protein
MRGAATRLWASASVVLTVGWFTVPGLSASASAAPVQPSAAVCPKAPPGAQTFVDDVTAWVKWGVLALIGISAVVSLGSILAGRIFSHPHASRYGAMGVAVVVMVAITYTVILVILNSITGSGCT